LAIISQDELVGGLFLSTQLALNLDELLFVRTFGTIALVVTLLSINVLNDLLSVLEGPEIVTITLFSAASHPLTQRRC